jgi:GNAT superfamily N-acetyltransferase
MDDSLKSRPARSGDAAEIARLAGELGYPATTVDMASRLAVLLVHPSHHVQVAEAAGALLGWIAVERRLSLESGERIEIVGLVVGNAARRRGVGSMLLADAEQWARAQGFAAITVRSNVLREASHPFYEREGYVRHKTQHVYTKALGVAS